MYIHNPGMLTPPLFVLRRCIFERLLQLGHHDVLVAGGIGMDAVRNVAVPGRRVAVVDFEPVRVVIDEEESLRGRHVARDLVVGRYLRAGGEVSVDGVVHRLNDDLDVRVVGP